MSEKIGTCRFCGQTMMVEWTEDEWLARIAETGKGADALASEHATENCKCKEGASYRAKRLAIAICNENIDMMFGDHYPSVAGMLREAAPLVYAGKAIRKMTIVMQEGEGVAMISHGKTGLKVEHKKVLHTELSTGY